MTVAPSYKNTKTTQELTVPPPPPNEPLDNRPVYWDSKTHAGVNNYLHTVMADRLPLEPTYSFLQLAKGVIVSPPIKGSNKTLKCFFRYNPNQFDYSYEFDLSSIGSTPATFTDATYTRGLALNATVSIELFFERIQDLWIGTPGGPGQYGVMWDIWAVERLVGVYGQSKGGDPTGPPVAQPMTLWLGGQNDTNAFNMSGLITGLDVNVTQFDRNMVPSMCTVDLQFVRILNPNANVANTASPISVSKNTTKANQFTASPTLGGNS